MSTGAEISTATERAEEQKKKKYGKHTRGQGIKQSTMTTVKPSVLMQGLEKKKKEKDDRLEKVRQKETEEAEKNLAKAREEVERVKATFKKIEVPAMSSEEFDKALQKNCLYTALLKFELERLSGERRHLISLFNENTKEKLAEVNEKMTVKEAELTGKKIVFFTANFKIRDPSLDGMTFAIKYV